MDTPIMTTKLVMKHVWTVINTPLQELFYYTRILWRVGHLKESDRDTGLGVFLYCV